MTRKIYPIYFLSKPGQDNYPGEITRKVIGIFNDAAEKFGLDVNILTGEEGLKAYQETFRSCQIHTHTFNIKPINSKNEVIQNVPGAIRNKILDINYQTINSPWIYMFDDDVEFSFKDSMGNETFVQTPEDLIKVLEIWQKDIDECLIKEIGMIGMPVVNKDVPEKFTIDDVRLCQAILLNTHLLKLYGIRYCEDTLIWEDFDLLIKCAHEGLHVVGINEEIHYKEIRQMFSDKAACNYNPMSISLRSINLYNRWGKYIIPMFRYAGVRRDALNIKVGSCKQWMELGCIIDFDKDVQDDLELFKNNKITLDEFAKRHKFYD